MKKIIITEEQKKNLFENTDLNKLTKMVSTNLDYYDTAFEIAKSLGILEELENNIMLLLKPLLKDIASKVELKVMMSNMDLKKIINTYIYNTRVLIYGPSKGLPNYDPVVWGMLKNVKNVVLNDFNEGEIPQDFALLPALKSLSTANCNFSSIPRLEKLEKLMLVNTPFMPLYKSIERLPNLIDLQVQEDDSLIEIPSGFSHPNIKFLDFSILNALKSFDVDLLNNFPQLQYIRIWSDYLNSDRKKEIKKEIREKFPKLNFTII